MKIFSTLTQEDQEILNSILDLYDSTIIDLLELENHTLLIRKSVTDLTYNEKGDYFHGMEVNVAIASAITAEARIFMSQLKQNPNLNLYYSDTDSAVNDMPLNEELVGNKLGQLKLECTIDKAVFLAPKIYALVTIEGKEIIKVKRLKPEVIDNLHLTDLDVLLIKDTTRVFTQENWFKSIIKGEITTNDIIYKFIKKLLTLFE